MAFIGNSHIAYWPLEACFPEWDCRNFGRPGEGLAYVEAFAEDMGDCEAVVQFGSNDLYRLNEENLEAYADRYVEAVQAIRSRRTYLFCIFPRNDYAGGSTSVNRFIARLNAAIRRRVEDGGGIVLSGRVRPPAGRRPPSSGHDRGRPSPERGRLSGAGCVSARSHDALKC